MWTILTIAYVLSVMLAISLTYNEQKQRGGTVPVRAAIGFLLCTVWPLVIAIMVLFYAPFPRRSPLTAKAVPAGDQLV